MCLRKLIKINARRALRGNWSRAMAIALLVTAAGLLMSLAEGMLGGLLQIPTFLDVAGTPANFLDDLPAATPAALALVSGMALLCLLVLTPLGLGAMGWHYRLGGGKVEEVSSVFEFFGSAAAFFKAVLLSFNIAVRGMLWTALFALPASALMAFASASAEAAGSDSELLLARGAALCAVVLGVMAAILTAIWLQRYYLAPYALIDNPTGSVREAIRRSIQATKGRRVALLWLEVTLLGWRLLGLLVVTQLYTKPYVAMVRALYGRYLIELTERVEPGQAQSDAVSSE